MADDATHSSGRPTWRSPGERIALWTLVVLACVACVFQLRVSSRLAAIEATLAGHETPTAPSPMPPEAGQAPTSAPDRESGERTRFEAYVKTRPLDATADQALRDLVDAHVREMVGIRDRVRTGETTFLESQDEVKKVRATFEARVEGILGSKEGAVFVEQVLAATPSGVRTPTPGTGTPDHVAGQPVPPLDANGQPVPPDPAALPPPDATNAP